MSVNVNDIAITSLETITAFDLTGNYLFMLDELQSATIAQTQEKQDITGKQGRKLSSLKKNKAVTISGNNGMVSCGLLEMQTGGTFESKAKTEVQWVDYLTITSNASATSYVAHGTSGAEIEELWVKNADGSLKEELTQAQTAASGKFAYNPSTKALTFYSGAYADGTEILVFYKRQIAANVLENYSDAYSEKCTLYIDALGEDKCGNVFHVQIYVPKADFNGEFNFEMGDNQTIHAFEAEAMAGACGTGGMLWSYTVFGAETADVADA